jgi:hypothetical protein
MKKFFVLAVLLCAFWAGKACAQPGYCDCTGGIAEDGSYWQLLDFEGNVLEDGDWVCGLWTGPDGKIDPPDMNGYPTGDDQLLPVARGQIEYGTFLITVATWGEGALDTLGNQKHPIDDDLIYCRIFDGPEESIGPGNYYADSQTHAVEWKMGDQLLCLFPGDPGRGHTDTPVPSGGAGEATPGDQKPSGFNLRQIYPNLRNPATEIEYALPQDAQVVLTVYDLQGVEIATLVDAHREAGLYTVRWDAQGLASGVYFCRLQAGDYSRTVKMVHFL